MTTRKLRLRVAVVINGLGTGGAERSLAWSLPGLRELGVDSVVITSYSRPEGVEAMVRDQGFEVHRLQARSFAGRVFELRRRLREIQPDLVHTTIIESDVLGRLASWRLGVPVLSSLVNTSYSDERYHDPRISVWRLELVRRFDRFTARHLTDHFHAISTAVAQHSVEKLGIEHSRITVVPRGRPNPEGSRESNRKRIRSALGVDEETKVVLAVGREEFQKGHDRLLRAVAAIADRRRPVVWIAGRAGSASRDLRGLVTRHGLGDRVRFLGHREDVESLLHAADLFVFPSRFEGLGGAAIEASAAAVPVLATDLPALREVGGEAFVYIPQGAADDPLQLAEQILALLDDSEQLRILGGRARTRFLEQFQLAPVVEQMAALYRSVSQVGGRPAPGFLPQIERDHR